MFKNKRLIVENLELKEANAKMRIDKLEFENVVLRNKLEEVLDKVVDTARYQDEILQKQIDLLCKHMNVEISNGPEFVVEELKLTDE